MNRTTCVLLVFLIATVPLAAFGQSVPEGFRDLKWGATQEQTSLAFPNATCRTERSERPKWTCTVRDEKVNDVPVTVMISGFITGETIGMSTFWLGFEPDGFDRIAEAFEGRHGKPSRVQKNDWVTKAGERLPSQQWEWVFPNSRITVFQHAGRFGKGFAMVILRPRQGQP